MPHTPIDRSSRNALHTICPSPSTPSPLPEEAFEGSVPDRRQSLGSDDAVSQTRTVPKIDSTASIEPHHATEFGPKDSDPLSRARMGASENHDQTRTVRSSEADTMNWDDAASANTSSAWLRRMRTHSPVDQRHTRTVVSNDPEASKSSTGFAARARTEPA